MTAGVVERVLSATIAAGLPHPPKCPPADADADLTEHPGYYVDHPVDSHG